MAYLRMEDTEVFQRARTLANSVYACVAGWDSFEKSTVGGQLVRAVDSIGANLVEGDGRETKADGLRFIVIARASAREARYWLGLAKDRGMLDGIVAAEMLDEVTRVGKMVSSMINARKATRAIREERAAYDPFG